MPTAARPPKRLALINVGKAAAMCDLTPAQLLSLLRRRATLITAAGSWPGRFTANPSPLTGTGDGQVWDRDTFRRWALQMGLTTHRGRHLIGYAGIAVMFGWQEQSVRARASRDRTFPAQDLVQDYGVVLYDRAKVLEYAVQTAIVFPDGRPNLDRPHRGDPVPKNR